MINIVIHEHQILVEKSDNAISLPNPSSINPLFELLLPIHSSHSHYVATIKNADLFMTSLPLNLEFLNIRQAMNHFDLSVIKEIVYYQQLNEYYKTHLYCGSCGNKNIRRLVNKFVYCETCKTENYPHIAPCIIVRIHHEDKMLMARGVNFPPNAWGLIAGFLEIGESLEDGIKRETKEEVGIEIEDIRYCGLKAGHSQIIH